MRPPRGASARGGLQTEEFALRAASAEVTAERTRLLGEQVAARAVAFTSSDAGADLVKLAQDEAVDLLLLDGRRPLLGGGVPRGDVGAVLEKAPCDVAVLVARESVTRRARHGRADPRRRSAAPSTTGRRSSSPPGCRRPPGRR